MTNEEFLQIESSQRQHYEELLFNQRRENEYERHAFAILKELGLMPYRDGSEWCVLWGDNIQEGVFATGDSIRQAVVNFYDELCN